MKKKLAQLIYIIYPCFFGLFFVFALYSHNVNEVAIGEVVLPSAATVGFASFLVIFFYLCFRDFRKATLSAAICVILFLSYSYVLKPFPTGSFIYLKGVALGTVKGIIAIPLWALLFVLGPIFINKLKEDKLDNLVIIFSVLSVSLFFVPSVKLAFAKNHIVSTPSVNNNVKITSTSKPDPLPDIYYIILDRYPSEKNLKESFGFDNSEFIDWLRARGFYVADDSKANYPFTSWSLTSSLSMNYLDSVLKGVDSNISDKKYLYRLFQDYPIWQFLKSQGYTFIHIGSWWEPTRRNQYADKNIRYSQLPAFSDMVLSNTWIYRILARFGLIHDFRLNHANGALFQFRELAKIPEMQEPTYTFAHINLPHPSYVFDKDGRYIDDDEENKRDIRTKYTEQIIFTNTKVKELIDKLINKSKTPPIIVLQADEAIRAEESLERRFDYPDMASKMRVLSILNAYYLPGVDKSQLYPSISPVNSFRLIFNLYFKTELPLLPDRSYWLDDKFPYKYYELTY